jgi:hypothetical protein
MLPWKRRLTEDFSLTKNQLGKDLNNHGNGLEAVRSLTGLALPLLFVINTGTWRANRVIVGGHANCLLLF